MPGSDTKNLTEVEKWKIYAEVCKWTDQKTGKIVNNGIERIIEGVKVEYIKVKERTVKKIKQAVDEFRRQGKPADLSQKDKEGRKEGRKEKLINWGPQGQNKGSSKRV